MKRRLFAAILCYLLIFAFTVDVNAASDASLVMDNADLLSDDEQFMLEILAQSVQDDYGMDAVILTIDSLDGKSAQNYADDYYDDHLYADDGLLLLVAMNEGEWYISTCGDAIYALTDYGIQELGEAFVPYLSSGDYYDAFSIYLMEVPDYLDAYNSGAPIDGHADYSDDYYHGHRDTVVYYEDGNTFGVHSVLLSLVIGLVAALITVLIMRSAMNTKRPRNSAGDYLKAGSYDLHRRQDMFLYSNVSKVRRQQNTSSGGHGGGSSVHRSSGGRSHGGGGGRF